MALTFPLVVAAAPGPDATWVALTPLPEKLDSPVFALAVDPSNSLNLVVGTSTGSIYRSPDGGVTWAPVRHGLGRGVTAIAFNPFRPGQVLAGVQAAGVWKSNDSGATWTQQPGTERASARVFGFARTMVAAGTDHGILASRLEGAWASTGLDQVSVGALALAAINDPARLIAGGDATRGQEPLPLYQSADGAATWGLLAGPSTASNMVVALAAGPLPPTVPTRPLLMGTNAAAFVSIDNGASWQQLSGAGVLPNTDFNQVAFAGGRFDRFYLGSDGGASDLGGLWATADSGKTFTPLKPPIASVTGLAVSADLDVPNLYLATFRPRDHAVMLWRLRDTGQPVSGPVVPVPPPSALPAPPAASVPVNHDILASLLTGPEGPFLALGAGAVAILFLAMVAYVRRGRA